MPLSIRKVSTGLGTEGQPHPTTPSRILRFPQMPQDKDQDDSDVTSLSGSEKSADEYDELDKDKDDQHQNNQDKLFDCVIDGKDKPKQMPVKKEVRQWLFLHGEMPDMCQPGGPKNADCTFQKAGYGPFELVVPPAAFVRCSLEGMDFAAALKALDGGDKKKPKRKGRRRASESSDYDSDGDGGDIFDGFKREEDTCPTWTITLDIKFEELPPQGVPLFQFAYPEPDLHAQAFYINEAGLLCVAYPPDFEPSVADSIKPVEVGKWQRICVTCKVDKKKKDDAKIEGYINGQLVLNKKASSDDAMPKAGVLFFPDFSPLDDGADGEKKDKKKSVGKSAMSAMKKGKGKGKGRGPDAFGGGFGTGDDKGDEKKQKEDWWKKYKVKVTEALPGPAVQCSARMISISPAYTPADEVAKAAYAGTSFSSKWAATKKSVEKQVKATYAMSSPPGPTLPMWRRPLYFVLYGDAKISIQKSGYTLVSHQLHKAFKDALVKFTGGWLDGSMCPTWQEPISASQLTKLNTCVQEFGNCISVMKRVSQVTQQQTIPKIVNYLCRKCIDPLAASAPGSFVTFPLTSSLVVPTMIVVSHISDGKFRLALVNTTSAAKYHPTHPSPPKTKRRNAVAIDGIPLKKITDELFWGWLWQAALTTTEKNLDEQMDFIYGVLLAWLCDLPVQRAINQTKDQPGCEFRSADRSAVKADNVCGVVLETLHYIVRQSGLSVNQAKALWLCLRMQLLVYSHHDVDVSQVLMDGDKQLVSLGCEQTAYHAAKASEKGIINHLQLVEVNRNITDLDKLVASKKNLNKLSSLPSDLDLSMPSTNNMDEFNPSLFTNFERCLKTDILGLEGFPQSAPTYMPVDMMRIRERCVTLDECTETLRVAVQLLNLMSVQSRHPFLTLKNGDLLKISLVQNIMTNVLPVPAPRLAEPSAENTNARPNPWDEDINHAQQLENMQLLDQVMKHFMCSASAMRETRDLFSIKLIVTAAAAAIADCLMRKQCVDGATPISMALEGKLGSMPELGPLWDSSPFGVSFNSFAKLTESAMCLTPELVLTRAAVLDYFASLEIKEDRLICKWERVCALRLSVISFLASWFVCSVTALITMSIWLITQGMSIDYPMMLFLAAVLAYHGYPAGWSSPFYFEGTTADHSNTWHWLLGWTYPEFQYWRDITFYWKRCHNTNPKFDQRPNAFRQIQSLLEWQFDDKKMKYVVHMFGNEVRISVSGNKFPSHAIPSIHTAPAVARTEDDLLFVPNMPAFRDDDNRACLGARDCELLLSYLTVPYLRIPLILTFFATEDRIHSLRSKNLQQVVECALFEPGRFLWDGVDSVPTELALDLDVGKVESISRVIIQFVLKITSRTFSYIRFILDSVIGSHPWASGIIRCLDLPSDPAEFSPDDSDLKSSDTLNVGEDEEANLKLMKESNPRQTVLVLEGFYNEMLKIFHTHVHDMCEGYIRQTVHACQEASASDDSHIINHQTYIACELQSHLVLMYRNLASSHFYGEAPGFLDLHKCVGTFVSGM
eukprot:gene1238-418_t